MENMEKDYCIRKILVCLDGSRMAEQILPYVTEQALRLGSKVVLFQAYIIPSMTIAEDIRAGAPIGPGLLEKEDEKMKNKVVEYLEGLAETLREKGVQVECAARRGAAGEAILDYSADENVDLIALVCYGHTGLGRVVFGSVVDHILKQSGLPVLLIRPREIKG
jgi:nucleotide-binding universal stress UspA family protein